VFGARIFIRFESAESTARLPAAFAPVSEKARFRFEVLRPLLSSSSSGSESVTSVPSNFDGAAFAVKKARDPDAPVRPEYVGWDHVRDFLRPNLSTDKIYSEELDAAMSSRNPETEPGNIDVHDCGTDNNCSHGAVRNVLSCEITRAGVGGTFVHCILPIMSTFSLHSWYNSVTGRACPRRLLFSMLHQLIERYFCPESSRNISTGISGGVLYSTDSQIDFAIFIYLLY
jgi:hypothetical protein